MIDGITLGRRALLGNMALLLGVAALPAEALAAGGKKAKPFLSKPRLALLEAVSDTIMPATDTPGALDAGVPARIDALLGKWAAPATRDEVVAALDRIDAAARAEKGKAFAAISATDREAFLRAYDAAALKAVPPPPGAPKPTIFTPRVDVVDHGYYRVKDMVLTLYYYSEPASTTELIYEHVPGAWQPSIPATPQTRPFLGTGPF